MKIRTTTALGAAFALAVAGCAELDVANPNQPDTEDALADPGDVESLIRGTFHNWWEAQHDGTEGMALNLSTVSFHHSAWPANFGMVELSRIPRQPLNNDTGFEFYPQMSWGWTQYYRALAGVRNGFLAMEEGVDLGTGELRARAFGRFVQGLAHGSIALLYDQGYVLDENVTAEELANMAGSERTYDELLEVALAYLDDAIALAAQGSFELPSSWMSIGYTNEDLARIAHAYKARFRALVARNLPERQGVDWPAVLDDLAQAPSGGFRMAIDDATWVHEAMIYGNFEVWSQVPNFYLGMADQSGGYQDWIATPVDDRMPFLYQTPDQRFPRGATSDEQNENPGLYMQVPDAVGGQWGQAPRGTWRWSYYRDHRHEGFLDAGFTGTVTELSARELRLLEAEAHYRLGSTEAAVAIIDETRVEHGGLGTAAANAECVPRLPDGSCGDVWEALKWEWRLETYWQGFGLHYFNSRGWGDLMEGTFLHLPVPARELQLLDEPLYTWGGVGDPGAAPVGTYGF